MTYRSRSVRTEPAIGAFATVIFYTDRRENTLSVPTDCVLTGNDNERYLFTVDESGHDRCARDR